MEQVSLENLAGGGVGERFADALAAVVENIRDLNTEPTKKREIKITLSISPDDDREVGRVTCSVETKLAPSKSLRTTFYMGTKSGEVVVYEQNPKQGNLFDKPGEQKLSAVDIKTKEAKG